jgi:hypothetical protein
MSQYLGFAESFLIQAL